MSLKIRKILEQFPELISNFTGDQDEVLSGAKPMGLATRGELILISDTKYLELETSSNIAIVGDAFFEKLKSDQKIKNLISSKNPKLLFAKVSMAFFRNDNHSKRHKRQNSEVSELAFVDPSAQIENRVLVSPHCFIGPGVRIGEGSTLEPGVTLGSNVQVGKDTHIHAQVSVGQDCQIGDRCEVHPSTVIGCEGYGYAQDQNFNHHRVTHFGAVVVKDDVHIGALVVIDRGTFEDSVIGAGTKIDNYCHFGHNFKIGEKCLVTAGFIAAGSVEIGDRCVFGGRTTVSGHLKIVSDCQFAGLTGVSKSILKPGKYGGFPCQDYSSSNRSLATLPLLPEMRKSLSRILKKMEGKPL